MCPICISAAALATMAGTGSAGGLAAFVAVKLRGGQRKGGSHVLPGNAAKPVPEVQKTRGEK